MKFISNEKNYTDFLFEIKQRIREAQYSAFKTVNQELILLYWDIGRRIVGQQEKYGWGNAVVETLARDLQKEYPGIRGFSVQNLWFMRQFYTNYKGNTKLQPLVREISWAKNLIIMGKCKQELERGFYLNTT